MKETPCDILLVDDEPAVLRLLSLRLERTAHYSVKAVASGEDALACLAAVQPRLVITDLRMDGGMDGMTLFEKIQRQRPDIPVIILTAHGTVPDAVKATHEGVFSFLKKPDDLKKPDEFLNNPPKILSKPIDTKELLDLIRKALSLTGPAPGSSAPTEISEWCRGILTRSTTMEALLRETWLVARSEASILITGESGTGKELLARAVHKASSRHGQPFLAINCGAIPKELLESELFGHSKGAFTGATTAHEGLFRAADGGTLFLDEIGDMPPALQVKLLRVLQERQVRPVGSTKSVAVNVRVVSATHRHLETLVDQGTFRQDLYYRLNVVNLNLPPLRERREDIPLLAHHFLKRLKTKSGRNINAFAPEALELLMTADWPGNIRQLYNVVEYCTALATTPVIPPVLVKKALRDKVSAVQPLAEARSSFERDYLTKLLRLTQGNVAKAAHLAQRNRTDFYKLLNRYHLDVKYFKERH